MLPPRTQAGLMGSAGAALLSVLPGVTADSLFPSPDLLLPYPLHWCVTAGAALPLLMFAGALGK